MRRQGSGDMFSDFITYRGKKIKALSYNTSHLLFITSHENIDDHLPGHERIEYTAIIFPSYEDIMNIEDLYYLRVVFSSDSKIITYIISRKIAMIKEISYYLYNRYPSN